MTTHDPRKTELLQLLREKSVRRGDFTLASGKKSDLYVDVRQTSLHARGAQLIGELLLSTIHTDVVGVGGMTMGADPLACSAAALSSLTDRPIHAFLIRKEPKEHGTSLPVEGLANLPKGSKVALLEDTTTTGGSLLKAIVAAEAAGLDVVQQITIVDRQEGASEMLLAEGYPLHALTTREELLA